MPTRLHWLLIATLACGCSAKGVLETASATIGAEGGVVKLSGGAFLNVPAQAFSTPTPITLERVEAAPTDEVGVLVSDEYRVRIPGRAQARLIFGVPVSHSRAAADIDPLRLRIAERGLAFEGTAQLILRAPLPARASPEGDGWQVSASIAPPADEVVRLTAWLMPHPHVSTRGSLGFEIMQDDVLDDPRWTPEVQAAVRDRLKPALVQANTWFEAHGFESPAAASPIPVILLVPDAGPRAFACVFSGLNGKELKSCEFGAARLGTGIFMDPFSHLLKADGGFRSARVLERTAAHELAHLYQGWTSVTSNETLADSPWFAEGQAKFLDDQVFDEREVGESDFTCPDFIADPLTQHPDDEQTDCVGPMRPYAAHPFFRFLGLQKSLQLLEDARTQALSPAPVARKVANGQVFFDFSVQYLYKKRFDREDLEPDAVGVTLEETNPYELWGECALREPFRFPTPEPTCDPSSVLPRNRAFRFHVLGDSVKSETLNLGPLSATRIDLLNPQLEQTIELQIDSGESRDIRVAVFRSGSTEEACPTDASWTQCSLGLSPSQDAVILVVNTNGESSTLDPTPVTVRWGPVPACFLGNSCTSHTECPAGQSCSRATAQCEPCPAGSGSSCSPSTDGGVANGCFPDVPICAPLGNGCGTGCVAPPTLPPQTPCCSNGGCFNGEYCSSASQPAAVQSTGWPEVPATGAPGVCEACGYCGRSSCPCSAGTICTYTPGGPSCPCEFTDCICVEFGNGCSRWTQYRRACVTSANCRSMEQCNAGFCEACSSIGCAAGSSCPLGEGRTGKCLPYGKGCSTCSP